MGEGEIAVSQSRGTAKADEMQEQEEQLQVQEILATLLHWWWLLLLLPLVGGLYTFVTTRDHTPVYRTESRILVQQVSSVGLPSGSDIWGSEQLAQVYPARNKLFNPQHR